MSFRAAAVLALSLFTAPLVGHAAQSAAQQTASQRYTTVTSGSATWVDRSTLPKTAKDRIAVLKVAMEDEITGKNAFKGDNDTPAFEIVSHGAELREVTKGGGKLSRVAASGDAAVYKVKAKDLVGGKLKTTILLPVSGHVGLADAVRYAKTNVFEIKVNGKLTKVPARGFVTDKVMELALKPGRNKITAEPYTGALMGYEEGRTIYIDVE